jgi:hypothetical protein
MNLSSLMLGFLPQAVLEDYLHFFKQFQEFICAQFLPQAVPGVYMLSGWGRSLPKVAWRI